KRNKTKNSIFKNKLLIFLFMFTIIFVFIDSRIRPQIITLARYKVQSVVTQAANQAIIEQMEQSPLSYGDLITVQRNENGEITLLSYNALEVNRLKSQITSTVISKVQMMDKADIYIPIGSISNLDMLNNKGPLLHFVITPAAFVETDIESEFETTGINQVNHRIFIVLKISASALIPNYSTDVEFKTRVCVAQTVIVGKVPENIFDNLHYLDD
ncbi:MAG: sporulation protein YunB, partial [Oscillospiraceae bacterium]|nr:sporulation protein YunB [Oscillospiraceae bacterium]